MNQQNDSARVDTAQPVAAMPLVSAEPKPGTAMKVFDLAQLPAEVTERVRQDGDLINIAEMTPQQIDGAKKIFGSFNLNNTASILTFAAAPQRSISAFLDELMAGITVQQAGVAGDIAKQMAAGIDLMRLDEVKKQIMNPPSTGWVAGIWHFLTGWTNYIRNFYLNQKPIRSLVDQMERKANNRMATLQADSDKLDKLADRCVVQIHDLGTWVLAGEMILLAARKAYLEKRESVLQTKDVVEASRLRDMARQIAALETRVLETEIAYVKAGNVTIPRIRSVQESDRIEIQNISEQILFQFPDFKAAIVLIAALNDTMAARNDRITMNKNQRKLDEVLDETVNETAKLAKESQGDALEKVQSLEVTINAIKTGIEQGIQLEADSRARRAEAHQLLVSVKDVVSDALKKSDIDSAQATG